MGLFDILVEHSPNKVFVSLLLGILAGLSYAFLMPMILTSLEPPDERLLQPLTDTAVSIVGVEVSNYRFAAAYLGLFLLILAAKSTSQILMSNVAIDATRALRERLYHHISALPIRDVESIGHAKLIVALTGDVTRIIGGIKVLPILMINSITIIGLLGFLVYLNVYVFVLILITLVLAIATYRLPMMLGEHFFRRSRKIHDSLQQSIRGLILGAKELKLNDRKRDRFFDENLRAQEKGVADSDKRAWTTMFLAITYGDLISLFVIGVVVFVIRNYYSISTVELLGIVMALLYAKGPISETLNVLPAVPSARVSLARLQSLFSRYQAEPLGRREQPGEAGAGTDWQAIHLDGIEYTYGGQGNDGGEDGFRVGPIDLRIERGEVTYIVGGNGSGKSTLAKLISLLYHPNAGTVRFGEVPIDLDNTAAYRQQISAIYLDFYLFDKLFDVPGEDPGPSIDHYLQRLELQDKLSVQERRFSTTDLSDGQKKRLALLTSLLEDRALYVFDEWAADQDPQFKRAFYTEILPELKARGKTVIVITHDDRYFKHADTVIHMENGKVRDVRRACAPSAIDGQRSDMQLTAP